MSSEAWTLVGTIIGVFIGFLLSWMKDFWAQKKEFNRLKAATLVEISLNQETLGKFFKTINRMNDESGKKAFYSETDIEPKFFTTVWENNCKTSFKAFDNKTLRNLYEYYYLIDFIKVRRRNAREAEISKNIGMCRSLLRDIKNTEKKILNLAIEIEKGLS
jgi:hypothetical protein